MVFIHGIGSSSKMWRRTIESLKEDHTFENVNMFAVDLLGYGTSPRPKTTQYNVSIQARSLHRTLKKEIGNKPVVLVGHSLGTLVAVEYAKRYVSSTKRLVLLSPPFYHPSTSMLPNRDKILARLYEEFANHPDDAKRILLLGKKYYSQINEGYSVDETNAHAFLDTLRSSIINQTSYYDALELTLPITIMTGLLDPLVIDKTIADLAAQSPYIVHRRVALAAHELRATYRKELIDLLKGIVKGIMKHGQ